MFKTGRVSSTDAARHTAQVLFAEDGEAGDFVSYDLPVLVTRPGDYSLPAKDALVLCAMQPGAEGVGWVLGAYYSDADAPPTDDAAVRAIRGDDLRLGSSDASAFVALANKVLEELDKVKLAANTHKHPSAMGPTGPADVTYSSASVAAAHVKAN